LGPAGARQRYEEATMCQRRPTDPMDPGDAADLSIMGLLAERPECPFLRQRQSRKHAWKSTVS